MTRAAATVTNAATDMYSTAAATDVSATDVNSAATATRMNAASMGTAGMGTAGATGMSTAAAATAVTAAAATVTRGNSYATLKVIFFVEDVKSRQADVRDFLLAQKNSPCIIRRFISWPCGC
jgi:hypothetical protein